jgi:hypothetical protein
VSLIKKVTLVVVVFILMILFVNLNKTAYDLVVKYTPSMIRSAYIEYILSDRDNVQGSNHIKVMLLRSLLVQSYEFDVKLLFSLCRRGDGEYDEPIPKLATRIVIKQYPDLINELILFYKDDHVTKGLIIAQINQESEKPY